ncbi:MAG: protein kinase domain-containing protein [Planctomycetota bacterium]
MKFTYATGDRPLSGFTIKRGIGGGGFGEVYYAVSDAGKEVALKRVQRHLDVELRGVQQCLNLKHPHLLLLFDIRHDQQEEAWVVMEYIVGESLRELLERQSEGLPLEAVDHWMEGLIAGVAYLHERGIVHRDLKPGNVFSDSGIIKVGDYGLSKFISCSHRSGQTESVGTVHYMAPEIGRGDYGKQIDIYALGILLYEMLTGQVPFDGESTQEIIMRHLTMEPDLSRVPAVYRDVVRRALKKDPQQRFRDAQEMRAALQSARGAVDAELISPVVMATPVEGRAGDRLTSDRLAVEGLAVRGGAARTNPVPPIVPTAFRPAVAESMNAGSTLAGAPNAGLTILEHGTDLIHGLAMTLPHTAFLSLIGVLLFRQPDTSLNYDLAVGAWFFFTSTLGSWLILLFGKLWEWRAADAIPRRLVMLAAGLVLGMCSVSFREYLLLDQPEPLIVSSPLANSLLDFRLSATTPQPKPLAVLLYCGSLFVLLSFWKQTLGLRKRRVTLRSVLFAGGVAFVIGCVVPFWRPWGPFLAVTISLSTQLAARWHPPPARTARRFAPVFNLCLATCFGLVTLIPWERPLWGDEVDPYPLSVQPEDHQPSPDVAGTSGAWKGEFVTQAPFWAGSTLRRNGDVDYLPIGSLTKRSPEAALAELAETSEESFKQYIFQEFKSKEAMELLQMTAEQLRQYQTSEPVMIRDGEQESEYRYQVFVRYAFDQRLRDELRARWRPVVRTMRLQGLGVLLVALTALLIIIRVNLPRVAVKSQGMTGRELWRLRILTLSAILGIIVYGLSLAKPWLLAS